MRRVVRETAGIDASESLFGGRCLFSCNHFSRTHRTRHSVERAQDVLY